MSRAGSAWQRAGGIGTLVGVRWRGTIVAVCVLAGLGCEEGPPPDGGPGSAVGRPPLGAGGAGPGGATGGDGEPGRGGRDDACATIDPGRVTLHRLNRAELDNTFRDLLGVDLKPAREFPQDDVGYGFDNIAAVLSTSPLLLEKLERAAEVLVDEALRVPRAEPDVFHFEAESLAADTGAAWRGSGWNLFTNGGLGASVELTVGGEYLFTARAFGQQAGPDVVRMSLEVDEQVIETVEVAATAEAPAEYSVAVDLEAGTHVFGVSFVNDYYMPDHPDPSQRDRNLVVDWLRVEGPMDLPAPPADLPRDRILTCDPAVAGREACGREIIAGFGRRAWRRPLTEDEIDRLLGFLELAEAEGDDFETGIKLAMRAMLLSPHFLYRVELDPDPTSAEPHDLTDHELATRLSYFLWSTMPDAELRAAADAGRLRDPAEIDAQVRRMLADPKARALVDNFAGQWLYIRAMDDVMPDYQAFPAFDDELRASMKTETRLFFETFLLEDRSALDMLDAGFTFIDERLARHYGLDPAAGEPVPGTDFRRVALPGDSGRAGLLTQGSVLTVTSFPRRTSPVKRGKWVLEQLLCSAPPPPPPEVEGRIEEVDPDAPLRERLAQHRADPVCAACHARMDPIGLGLEQFDGIGAWRDLENGHPVDASGEFPDGRTFDGAVELSALLKQEPALARCMAEKLFTYALGRGPQPSDHCVLEDIEREFAAGGHRFSALIGAIARSPAFRQRRGERPGDE